VDESDSPMTTAGRILFVTTRCCNYSLFELLMLGECFTQNVELFVWNKTLYKKCHLVGTF
jgi:hypothetical protein